MQRGHTDGTKIHRFMKNRHIFKLSPTCQRLITVMANRANH